MEEHDPIRKERTIFEKIRDKILGNRRKKIYVTTYNPYTKKEKEHVIGTYKFKHQSELEEHFRRFGMTVVEAGVSVDEANKNLIKNMKKF